MTNPRGELFNIRNKGYMGISRQKQAFCSIGLAFSTPEARIPDRGGNFGNFVAILVIFEKKPHPTGDKSARGVVIYKE